MKRLSVLPKSNVLSEADAVLTDLNHQVLQHRAIDAALWGMPIVSVHAMRRAFLEDAKAKYNDFVYWSKPADWKCQVSTPTDTALYGYFNINTEDGPVVVEIPASVETGLWGGLMDAWQVAIVDVGPKGSDEGKGGKYLILPPDFKGDIPVGYFVVHSDTYNDYSLLRFIPKSFSQADLDSAIAMIKKCRIYPLAKASNPPEQCFIDMAGKLFDGIVGFDETYYANLAEMVNEEPVQEKDMALMGYLLSLGIEKGKDFQPDTDTQHILAKAAEEAHTWLMNSVETHVEPFWTDSLWGLMVPPIAMASNGTFRTPSYLDVDARAITYFQVFTNSVVAYRLVDPKVVPATFYLATFRDANGDPLRGEESYKLHVPADAPTKQFWSVTLYDRETCGLIRDMPRTGVDSYQKEVEENADGSVDIYIGPKAPAGKEGNWVPTVPGRGWFPYFRLYAPEKTFFKKTWKLPDIERVH